MITEEELIGLCTRERNGLDCDNERGMGQDCDYQEGTDRIVITAEELIGL